MMSNYAKKISELLKTKILEQTDEKTAVSFSGGIDSTTIATVATSKNSVGLICAGIENSKDMHYSEKIARELITKFESKYFQIKLTKEMIFETYSEVEKILSLEDLLKIEIMIPVYQVVKKAREEGYKSVMFGAGAEELFVGYKRYYDILDEGKDLESILKEEFRNLKDREISWTNKICSHFGISAKAPFYDEKLARYMFAIPIVKRVENRHLKKGLIREAATFLGVSSLAINRKKQAMQYGSGIHKILLNHFRRS